MPKSNVLYVDAQGADGLCKPRHQQNIIFLCYFLTGSIVKAAKIRPSVFKNEVKNEKDVCSTDDKKQPVARPKKEFDKEEGKSERNVVAVELTVNYVDILKRLEKDSRPLMAFLKTRQVLSSEHQFFMLQSDVTRFLLRQHEMKYGKCPTNSNGELS